MEYKYKTHGTCSTEIDFSIDEEGKLHNVHFERGCNGNLKGISALVEGEDALSIASKIEGTRCRDKETSCPDQFAKAIKEALASRK